MRPLPPSPFPPPSQPFELDYFQVLITTCELLIETYTKISTYLGGGGSASSQSQSQSAAAGLFPSPPGSGSRGSAMSPAGPGAGAGVGSAGLSQALADVVYKVDGRLKVRPALPCSLSRSPTPDYPPLPPPSPRRLQKLVALLSKEIDLLARQAIKAELDSLSGGGLLDLLE